MWWPMDVDGTGSDAMTCLDEASLGAISYVASNGTPDLVTSVSNGIGYTSTASYAPLTNASIYTKDSGANAATYPTVDVQVPSYAVSSLQAPNGIGGTATTNYAYGGLKLDLTGRGSLGFRWVSTTNAQTSLNTTATYLQSFPYTGQISTITKSLPGSGNGGTLENTTTTPGCMANSNSGCTVAVGQYYYRFVSQKVTNTWDLNGATFPSQTTSYVFDSFGNPLQIKVSTSDGFTRTTNNTFNNDTTHWFIGKLIESQVNATTP